MWSCSEREIKAECSVGMGVKNPFLREAVREWRQMSMRCASRHQHADV